jgi:hypothetical protein
MHESPKRTCPINGQRSKVACQEASFGRLFNTNQRDGLATLKREIAWYSIRLEMDSYLALKRT